MFEAKVMTSRLLDGAGTLGLRLSEEQLRAFGVHAELIARWSGRVRLVGSLDPEVLAIRHFLDALTVDLALEGVAPASAIDLGSGAGFPGLVLAVVWPDTRLLLVESDRRKAAFLNTAVASMGLSPRVRVVAVAAEGEPEDEEIGRASLVVARAVRPPARLLSWLSPYRAPGGIVLAMLGPAGSDAGDLEEEALALGLRARGGWRGDLPGGSGRRRVLTFGE